MSGPGDYPLTFEQESIWVADQFAGHPSPYLETWAQRLVGPLDVSSMERALAEIVTRHPVLRSQFLLVDDHVVQRVLPHRDVALERLAWPGGSLGQVLRRAGQRPLDTADSSIRMTLFERPPNEHVLLVQCHHIVVDDFSLSLLSSELETIYAASVCGTPARLPWPLTEPGDYALQTRARGIPASSLEYWVRYLDGAQPLSDLPPRGRRLPRRRSNDCDRVTTTLTADVAKRVRALARTLRTTPNVVFSASLALSVGASVDARDVVIGSPVSRRGSADLDRVFGCLTDLLPLRLSVQPHATFAELCAAAKRGFLAGLRYRDAPYASITRSMRSARAVLSGDVLARVVIVVDDDAAPALRLPRLECERIYVAPAAAKFDWCVFVVADGHGYLCFADYAKDYFTREEATSTLRQWTLTLDEVAMNPDITVGDVATILRATS